MRNFQAIHRDSQELEGRINTATADTRNSKNFNEDEGRTILREFQALAPEIVATLQNLDNQHRNLAAERGRDAVVESDLKTLSGDTVAFENALLDKEPVSILLSSSRTLLVSICCVYYRPTTVLQCALLTTESTLPSPRLSALSRRKGPRKLQTYQLAGGL